MPAALNGSDLECLLTQIEQADVAQPPIPSATQTYFQTINVNNATSYAQSSPGIPVAGFALRATSKPIPTLDPNNRMRTASTPAARRDSRTTKTLNALGDRHGQFHQIRP
jgi:hypothetical protein